MAVEEAPLGPETARPGDALKPVWLLVIPVFTHVLPEAFQNFLEVVFKAGRDLPQYAFHVTSPARMLLHAAMNACAEAVVGDPRYAGLITFDDDCLPPPDVVGRLIAHYEAGHAIVSGLGYMRGYPYRPTIARYFPEGPCLCDDGQGGLHLSGFDWLEPPAEPGLVPVDFAGMPVTLIARRVFEQMTPPYFQNFLDGGQCTHDVYFYTQAKRAGVAAVVDTRIDCGHLVANPIVNAASRRHILRAVQRAVSP